MKLHEIRAGVIGAGFIGPVHLEALRRLGVQVTALCDVPAKAAPVAERWGIPEVFDAARHKDLIGSPHVDVVHITAPNRFHCAMALEAIFAGKHCVCEKPLAMNSLETARIVQAAQRSGTVFAVNYNVRFYPAVLQLRQMVAGGQLGRIVHVNGSYFQDWLIKETDYNWRLLPREGGKLRAVADIGTHWMDAMSFILGARVKSVLADLHTFHKRRQRPLGEVQTFTEGGPGPAGWAAYPVRTEDFASILLEFDNRVPGNLAVSQVAAGRKNCIRLEIYGSLKSAWWNSEQPNTIGFGNRDGWNEVAVRNTPGFGQDISAYTDYPAGHNEGFPDTFKMLFRSVYRTIAAGGRGDGLHATAEDGHWEVKVCEAIARSHAARAWTRV